MPPPTELHRTVPRETPDVSGERILATHLGDPDGVQGSVGLIPGYFDHLSSEPVEGRS